MHWSFSQVPPLSQTPGVVVKLAGVVVRVEVEVDLDRGDVRVVGGFMVDTDVSGVFVVNRTG